MKKYLISLILGAVCMTGVFAKTAVVYFSCTGNTERLAQTAAKALEADLFEIVPEQAYTNADLNWNDKKSRSSVECSNPKSRPGIKELRAVSTGTATVKFDISKYDTVVIAFPVWWYKAPMIIYTFVENVDLSGKKVVPIATSGGSGIGSSGSELYKACGKGNWLNGKVFRSGAGESELKKFFESVLK